MEAVVEVSNRQANLWGQDQPENPQLSNSESLFMYSRARIRSTEEREVRILLEEEVARTLQEDKIIILKLTTFSSNSRAKKITRFSCSRQANSNRRAMKPQFLELRSSRSLKRLTTQLDLELTEEAPRLCLIDSSSSIKTCQHKRKTCIRLSRNC